LWKNYEYRKSGMESYHDAWSTKQLKRAGEIRHKFKLFDSTIDPTDIQQVDMVIATSFRPWHRLLRYLVVCARCSISKKQMMLAAT